MSKNEMCKVFLDVSYYFWKSEKAIAEAKKYRVRKEAIAKERIRSYTEALIRHDRMFDDLDGKVV